MQKLFDQLILIYDNLQSMEIAAEELNKMKQKNKQPFSTFIPGFEKKMLETGGMDFNDQITKTFFNNVFNNEMHKTFIGFFIPESYIVYYTMLYGMSNQFEILRMKDGTTTTNKNYRGFYYGRFHHGWRNGLGVYRDQFSNENGKKADGKAEGKMGLSNHHKGK